MTINAPRTGHGYCCGTFAVSHHSELVSVCFQCGKFYDNQTWTERPPLGKRESASVPATDKQAPIKRYFYNE